MRFLITCYRLDLTGTSTYTFTLASELRKKGIDVDVFSPFPEIMSGELKKIGVRVHENLEEVTDEKYACIIAQHNILALMVRSIKPEVPMIFLSHGVLLPQAFIEVPPSIDVNIQKYIAVSEEVKDNLVLNHRVSPKNVEVVRNFVNVNRFFPQSEISERPKVVLFISNLFASKVYRTIKDACKKLNLKLNIVGKTKKVPNIEDYINQADIVVSLGRGILEGMACGRAAIVYDYQGGDGMISEENITEIRKHNFSGRRFKKNYGVTDLIQEIKKYEKCMGKINREIILKDYSVSLVSDKIINICNQVQKNFCPKPIAIPHKELVWYQNQIRNIYNSRTWKLGLKMRHILLPSMGKLLMSRFHPFFTDKILRSIEDKE